jgi:hypothetical protein
MCLLFGSLIKQQCQNGHNLGITANNTFIQPFKSFLSSKKKLDNQNILKRRASADATGRKEEPVHENAFTIVVGIVSQESMPLVFLLATAVAVATARPRFPIFFKF